MITQCNDTECRFIMKSLVHIDPKIKQRVTYVQNNYGVSLSDALEYVVTNNIALWANVYVDWEARDYQIPIVTECKKSKKLVLRLGRRLGKTDSMCIAILWYAYTQYNKGDNNQYDIVIATPYETQIDLIFKRLKQLLAMSPVLTSLITKDVQHKLVLNINGIDSNIIGFTAGANNSSGGANSTRGQRADLLVLDEADKP